MKTKNIKYVAFSLLTVAFAGVSCSDDETYDVVGNPNNLVYIANANNVVECNVYHTPVGEFGEVAAQFGIKSVHPTTKATTATLELDNSLVEAYNAANGTSYVAINPSLVTIENTSINIPKATAVGEAEVSISIDNADFASLTEDAYLIPIRIADVSGDGIESLQRGNAYVVVKAETRLIKPNAGPADVSGTLVSDYSAWTASYSTGTAITTVAEIFDGNITNGPQLRADEQDGKSKVMIFDMKSATPVTALRVARYYRRSWDAYYFSSVKISVSNDGQNWTVAGTAVEDEMTKSSGYQYIVFYGAVPTRYLKLEIESGGSAVSSLAELGVYAQ